MKRSIKQFKWEAEAMMNKNILLACGLASGASIVAAIYAYCNAQLKLKEKTYTLQGLQRCCTVWNDLETRSKPFNYMAMKKKYSTYEYIRVKDLDPNGFNLNESGEE
jgi:hypothetical protein